MERRTERVKALPKNSKQCLWPGLKPGTLLLESSALTMRPLHMLLTSSDTHSKKSFFTNWILYLQETWAGETWLEGSCTMICGSGGSRLWAKVRREQEGGGAPQDLPLHVMSMTDHCSSVLKFVHAAYMYNCPETITYWSYTCRAEPVSAPNPNFNALYISCKQRLTSFNIHAG